MKILYLTPFNPFIKTPETGFAEELSKRGHEVVFSFGYNQNLLYDDYDIIYGAMEYSMNLAIWLGKKLNKPVYNHMEWIPPWRVGIESPEDWGYEGTAADQMRKEVPKWTEIYIQQMQDWENATVRTLSGECFKKHLKHYATKPIVCNIKYYAVDFKKLEKYKDEKLREKYQIMSTARLVPHKRIIHIVRALAKIKNPPVYKIIGYGPEMERIQREADVLGVKVEFLGPGDDGLKEKTIQESMFSVNIWAGIPMGESFYYKKPAISYAEPHIEEVFKDSVLYAGRNNIEDLAKKIQLLIDNPIERKLMGEKAHDMMFNDKINMGTTKNLMNKIEQTLEFGVKQWEK